MNFVGKAKRLDDIDLPAIGALIGVGEDEIHAFMDVEAAGSGFDKSSRPKMLFEPHVFYKLLPPEKRGIAVKAGLAYPKWGMRPYPADSYPRLARAINLDETAALKAASWGGTQILGKNHEDAGYATVQEMVRAFCDDEENHIKAMVMFMLANDIADDLRAHRWAVVARVYNGPGYAKYNYHGRMADAFAKWKRIRDTPYTPISIPPVVEAPITASGKPWPDPAPIPAPAPETPPSPPEMPGNGSIGIPIDHKPLPPRAQTWREWLESFFR